MKILFVAQKLSSFIKKDLDILAEEHDVRVMQFVSVGDYWRNLINLVRGIWWCDISFSWFGKLHAFFAVLFSRILGKKSIVIAGGDDVARVPEIKYGMFCFWWKKWCPLFVFRNADRVISVSRYSAENVCNNVGIDRNKVEMIYHGFASTQYKKNLLIKKDNMVITIGNIDKGTLSTKGLKLFVQAAALLPNVEFLLIGPDRDGAVLKLKKIAPGNLAFSGEIYGQELIDICSKAKVYVQASVHESFGCALAEAMLCECIPVTSKNAAIPEVCGDAGVYLDEHTPEELARKIKIALDLPETEGKRARQRIMDAFPLSRRRSQILKAINEIAI